MNLHVKTLYLTVAFILGAVSAQTINFLQRASNAEHTGVSEHAHTPESINLEAIQSPLPTYLRGAALHSPLQKLASIAPNAYRRAQSQLEAQHTFLMVQELSASKPTAAIAILDYAPAEQQPRLALAIAKHWSLQDPASALAWLQGRQGSLPPQTIESGIQSVLSNYAKVAPLSTFAEIHTLTSPERQAILLAEIGDALAEKNPEGAVAWLAGLDPNALTPEAINGAYANVMTRYLEYNPEAAAHAITQIESPNLQRELAPEMAVHIAHTNMEEALSWVDALHDLPAKQASLAAIAEHNLQDAPEAALIALLSFPELLAGDSNPLHETLQSLAPKAPQTLAAQFHELPHSTKPQAALALTQTWIEKPKTLPDFQNWLERLEPGDQSDPSFSLLAQHYAAENPAEAFRWADRLHDKGLRFETLRETVYESPSGLLPSLVDTLESLELANHEKQALENDLGVRLEATYAEIILP